MLYVMSRSLLVKKKNNKTNKKILWCRKWERQGVTVSVLFAVCVSNSSESLICNYSSLKVPTLLFVVWEPKLFQFPTGLFLPFSGHKETGTSLSLVAGRSKVCCGIH